jgi:hypothetical protein
MEEASGSGAATEVKANLGGDVVSWIRSAMLDRVERRVGLKTTG